MHRSGQPEETHENVAYFHPTISQSTEEREERESKRHQSCDRPACGIVWCDVVYYGMTWYFKVWRGMMCSIVPPNNHTSRLINHKSCHLGQLIHRILNPCDDQFDFNCLLFSEEEEEPDHYCHRVSSFSKLHILKEYKSISCVVCFSLGLIDAASSIKAQ